MRKLFRDEKLISLWQQNKKGKVRPPNEKCISMSGVFSWFGDDDKYCFAGCIVFFLAAECSCNCAHVNLPNVCFVVVALFELRLR